MPALTENTIYIDLAPAKPKGLALTQLGVPIGDDTLVKKGAQHEFLQHLEDGAVGRRYQNIRATAVKTAQGAHTSAKLFLQFEVFGDDNVPAATNSGFAPALYAGEQALPLPASSAFLPYAGTWYENQYVYDIPADLFETLSRVQFTACADEVRGL